LPSVYKIASGPYYTADKVLQRDIVNFKTSQAALLSADFNSDNYNVKELKMLNFDFMVVTLVTNTCTIMHIQLTL
jgi:hypothetical protein